MFFSSTSDGHLNCFHFGAIMNKAAMKIPGISFGAHIDTFLLGICLDTELICKCS